MKYFFVKLNGGLGNQLFQYAMARCLVSMYDGKLLFDVENYSFDSYGRDFLLNKFNVKGGVLKNGVLKKLYTPGNRIFSLCGKLKLLEYKIEKKFLIDRSVFDVKRPFVYIEGYWQTEEYFKQIRNDLLKELTLKEQSVTINELFPRVGPIASVHIRNLHGVYKNKTIPKNDKYGRLPLEYYRNAMAKLKKNFNDLTFLIFSDDTNWCKRNLEVTNNKIIYFDDLINCSDYEQLILMSQCDHQIISNSTFSWWGAWLCNKGNNVIIRPGTPFNDSSLLYEKHYPDSWMIW